MQHHPAAAAAVLDVELAALTRERRAGHRAGRRRRRGHDRARRRVELDPAAEHAHPVARQRGDGRLGAQRLEQLAVLAALGLFLGNARGVGVEQAGKLGQVDRRRVRQAADHFAGEVALHLLRLELAHELLQQSPGLLGRLAADADRGEKEAVALTLKHTNGNQTKAARLLGISRPTLAKKMGRPSPSQIKKRA